MPDQNTLTQIQSAKGDAVVVFVHGILSNAQTAWMHENGTFWPLLFASEKSLSSVGVCTFEYPAAVGNRTFGVDHAAQLLYQELRSAELLSKRVLIFVCHSLGGIIVRHLILSRQLEIKDTIIGVVLVASPSLGSDYANLLRVLIWVTKNRQAGILRFSDTNEFLNALDANFFNLVHGGLLKIRGFEIIETDFLLPSNFRRRLARIFFSRPIVRALQGNRYFTNFVPVPYSDHFSVAKPPGKEAIQHRALMSFVLSLLKDTERKVRKRKGLAVTDKRFIPALKNAEDQLKNGGPPGVAGSEKKPYDKIINELERERETREQGLDYSSAWEGPDLRDLPAFLEGVWESLNAAGSGTMDAAMIYDSLIGHAVLLCDASITLWADEPVPRSPQYWGIFNEFAEWIKSEAVKGPRKSTP